MPYNSKLKDCDQKGCESFTLNMINNSWLITLMDNGFYFQIAYIIKICLQYSFGICLLCHLNLLLFILYLGGQKKVLNFYMMSFQVFEDAIMCVLV